MGWCGFLLREDTGESGGGGEYIRGPGFQFFFFFYNRCRL